jgi:arylsulfatase
MFMSDNGGNAEGFASGLGNNYASGPIGSAMSYLRCGGGWASAQNTPFKEYKHYIHEGGIHTSFIAHWPNGISDKGAIRSQIGHVMDIMPTVVEVSGATYPASYNGHIIPPMQGVSLIPAFNNSNLNRDTIVWEHEANRGIRIGNLKCVAKVNPLRKFTATDHNRWELYDLAADPTEMVNLATLQPALVRSMIADWERYAVIKKFLPWPWGYYATISNTSFTTENQNGIKAYPNPCDQMVHHTCEEGTGVMQLIGLDGKAFLNQPIKNSMDVSGIADGYYILHFKYNDKSSNYTNIIVKHSN